ncbi:uncharacterized protein LOC141643014 [Silene latifolia]|uniref:uncharacterized protein LOC141643014 n=1 Tax=Silene latifolia TaxID=37657 RepID=UPI003D76DF90
MFTKLFSKKSSGSQDGSHSQKQESLIDLNPRVISHYGIPSTASRLAYDPIQQLLAVGTLDGRIKVMGGDNIEGLLASPKEIPFKNIEFLHNQGFLVSISNENDIQVWDLEHRHIAASLHWQSNITAFAIIQETNYMYVGDDCGLVNVLKYDARERNLLTQKFNIPPNSVSEAAATSLLDYQSVVGILPQPCSGRKRVLFAYDSGVIVLWDVSKDQLVLIRGLNDQQINDRATHPTKGRTSNQKDKTTCDEQERKEVISLCWASLDGSVVAVGYVDGDILLWNLSSADKRLVNNMVKLQLSSADKRFPVIVLHWSASGLDNDHGGQLFVYGGDEIGSSEVLTILSLEWSPGRDALKSIIRANITLEGSFADMILLPAFNIVENTGTTSLFLLSSPGQLQFFDGPCLSEIISHHDNSCTIPVNYRSTVPTTEPYLTVGKLVLVHKNTQHSLVLSEMASELKKTLHINDTNTKWPLNGGLPCQLPPPRERIVERLYIAGYKDGSVRLWDATYPMLSPLCILSPEVRGISTPGATASISAVDFSTETLNIAVGNSSGMVCLYLLAKNTVEAKLHVVSGSETKVYDVDEENRSQLSAVFTMSNSPVCTLRYIEHGARLAVGYESGQVTVLSVNSPSVLFVIDALSSSSSPIVSLSSTIFRDNSGLAKSLDESESGRSAPRKELTIALRRDALVATLDSSDGCIISSTPKEHIIESPAISMYILEDTKCVSEIFGGTYPHALPQEDKANTETEEPSGHTDGSFEGIERSLNGVQSSENLRVLVCCTEMLLLYSFESLIQGHFDSIFEVKLQRPICWTSVFKIDEARHALLLLYQNGSIEIRCLPKLEVLGKLSLMSILRWNFKTNMEKTISSTENGQLTLVNGCEFAVVSLLARENDFRIPQSLPCLHDKAMAAALNMNFSLSQKKNKETPSGILGGMIKGLRASKKARSTDHLEDLNSPRSSLDRIFSRSSDDPIKPAKDAGEVMELNIDDIEIEGPLRVTPIAENIKLVDKDKSTERKKLFEGATSEKPKQRSINDIKAKYRKNTSSDVASAASAASEARNKLLERQEKLDRIGQNSEELRNGAENFASMAKELAKRMENRKWWQL